METRGGNENARTKPCGIQRSETDYMIGVESASPTPTSASSAEVFHSLCPNLVTAHLDPDRTPKRKAIMITSPHPYSVASDYPSSAMEK